VAGSREGGPPRLRPRGGGWGRSGGEGLLPPGVYVRATIIYSQNREQIILSQEKERILTAGGGGGGRGGGLEAEETADTVAGVASQSHQKSAPQSSVLRTQNKIFFLW